MAMTWFTKILKTVLGLAVCISSVWYYRQCKRLALKYYEDNRTIKVPWMHQSTDCSAPTSQTYPEYELLISQYFLDLEPFGPEDFEKAAIEGTNQWNSRGSSILVQIIGGEIYVDGKSFTTFLPWDKLRYHHILGRLQSLKLGDLEFILNTHDCPLRKKLSLVPIFSITRCQGMRVLPVPQWFTWRDGAYENWDAKQMEIWKVGQESWDGREAKAIFRGNVRSSILRFNQTKDSLEFVNITSSTMLELGRTRLFHLGTLHPDLLDVGLFGKGLDSSRHILDMLPNYEFKKAISLEEQSRNFKYIIYAEGSCGWADRLKLLMVSGMLILLQQTPCYEHFSPLLRPWEHYVPLANDFSDLIDKILWARNNEEKVREIIQNAASWAFHYNTKDAWDYYLKSLFQRYQSLMMYKPVLRPGMKQFVRPTRCSNRRNLQCNDSDSFVLPLIGSSGMDYQSSISTLTG